MTERPFVGGADTAVDPTPGYYPDPSVPGFVRYWGGTAWVPGTSRPAPKDGEVLQPPRFASRQPASVSARYVPPPVVAPEARAAQVAEVAPAAQGGPAPLVPSAVPTSSAAPVSAVETGPVYFDQTSAGASFTLAPHAELELRPSSGPGPLPESAPTAEPDVSQPPAAQGDSRRAAAGWHVDPKAQRGLLEAE